MSDEPDIESNPIYDDVLVARALNRPVYTLAQQAAFAETARISKLADLYMDNDPAGWDGVA